MAALLTPEVEESRLWREENLGGFGWVRFTVNRSQKPEAGLVIE